jgi:hypothetical protein
MSPVTNSYYFERMPNGNMFMAPIVRPLQEVISERTQVAEFFRQGPNAEVLAGVCDLIKADMVFKNKKIIMKNMKVSTSLEMQHKIDIYNTITAKELIEEYKKNRDNNNEKKYMKRIKDYK